jgi:hypothetical protein
MFSTVHTGLSRIPSSRASAFASVYTKVSSFDDFEPWLEQVVHFPEEIVD